MSDIRYVPSLKMMVDPTRLYTQAEASPSAFFKWVLYQVLLGEPVHSAMGLLDHHLVAFTRTDAPSEAVRSVRKWGDLAAAARLLEQPDHLMSQMIEHLPAYETPVETYQHLIIQHLLALAALIGDTAMLEKWQQHARRLPLPEDLDALDHLDVTYELLYMTQTSVRMGADSIDDMALACARLSHACLLGLPFYSAAPLVLVLADLAEKRGTTATTLLTGSLHALDTMVFGETATPRIQITQRPYVCTPACCRIPVEVRGMGTLRIGPFDIMPLTCGLPVVLFSTLDRLHNARSAKKREQLSMLEDALYTAQGQIVAELHTNAGVILDELHAATLERRIGVAWQYVQGYDTQVIGQIKLDVPVTTNH